MSTLPPCVGKHALFDSTEPDAHAEAAHLCAICPLIDACEQRLAEIQSDAGYYGHPEGTWAGGLVTEPQQSEARRLAHWRKFEERASQDAAYTEAEARRAHSLYTSGVRNDWTRTGHLVYDRRRKARERMGRAS